MATDWVHIDTAWDMVREECAKLEAELAAERHLVEVLTEQRNALTTDRDDWRDLAERAIAQIEQWKILCERWEQRYNQLQARSN